MNICKFNIWEINYGLRIEYGYRSVCLEIKYENILKFRFIYISFFLILIWNVWILVKIFYYCFEIVKDFYYYIYVEEIKEWDFFNGWDVCKYICGEKGVENF